MKSRYQNIGKIEQSLPFNNRLLYMHKSRMDDINLPKQFEDYYPIITEILSKVKDRNNVCYITIDEKTINNGTHRRPGIHVDFNWFEESNSHTQPGTGGHKRPKSGKWDTPSTPIWKNDFADTGGMLLVSNYPGCAAYKGIYDGQIGEGGNCSNINTSNLNKEIMKPNEVYYVNSLGIHESLKINEKVNRSLIRINFHPEYNFN